MFGASWNPRNSIGAAMPLQPSTPVRIVGTPQGLPPQAVPTSPSMAPPRPAMLDRNNSLQNLATAVTQSTMKKSISSDRLDSVINGKGTSSSPRVQASPRAMPSLSRPLSKSSANADTPKTEIRNSSATVETPRGSMTPGSKQPDQSGQRSLVVSRTPPRQPSRRSSTTTPRAPIAPEDIGHFVGQVGDSIDRGALYPRGRYCIVRKLGAGVYGKVLECDDRKYNARVAIKIIRREPPVYREAVKKEIKVLMELDGLYGTLKMLRTFEHQGHVCLSLELLGIPLNDKLKDTDGLPLDDIRDIGLQLFHAMEYVHKRGIIHTDIKPDNILIARDKNADGTSAIRVKMVDFGSAIGRGEWHPPLIGTLEYRAPESVLQATYNQAVDIWALGCVMVELHTSKVFFRGASRQETEGHLLMLMEVALGRRLPEALVRKGAANKNQHNTPFMSRNSRGQPAVVRTLKKGALPYQTITSVVKDETLLDLVLKAMTMEPEKRITASEAKSHPFFKTSLLDATSVDEFGHLKSHARRAAPSPAAEEAAPDAVEEEAPKAAATEGREGATQPQGEAEQGPPETAETRGGSAETLEARVDTPETVVTRPRTRTPEPAPKTNPPPPEVRASPEAVPAPVPDQEAADAAEATASDEAAGGAAEGRCAELNETVEISAESVGGARVVDAVEGGGGEDGDEALLEVSMLSQTASNEAGSLHASTSTVSVEDLPRDLRAQLGHFDEEGVRDERGRRQQVEVYSRRLSGEMAGAGPRRLSAEVGSGTPSSSPSRADPLRASPTGKRSPPGRHAPPLPPAPPPPPQLSPRLPTSPGRAEQPAGAGAKPAAQEERAMAPPAVTVVAPGVSQAHVAAPGGEQGGDGSRTLRVSTYDHNMAVLMAAQPQTPLPARGSSPERQATHARSPLAVPAAGQAQPSATNWTEAAARPASVYSRPPSGGVSQASQREGMDRAALVDWHSKRIEDLDMRLRANVKRTASGGRVPEALLRENVNANGQPSSPPPKQPLSPLGKLAPPRPDPAVDAPLSGSPLRNQLRGSLHGADPPSAEQVLRQALASSVSEGETDGTGVESEVELKLRSLRHFINEAMQEGLYQEGAAAEPRPEKAKQQPPPPDEVGSSQESAMSTVWLGDEERKVDADGRVHGEDANVYLL